MMASFNSYALSFTAPSSTPNKPLASSPNQLLVASKFPLSRSTHPFFSVDLQRNVSKTQFRKHNVAPNLRVVASSGKSEPLRVMISGAPASGKGTQCELITKKYDLVHIEAGDLLRAEVAAGTENGKRAKEYMEKGQLVPNEIVVTIFKDRLSMEDSLEKGWLLDGYPRSESQATALKSFGFDPDVFILLEVPEEILVERVVGRRLDPVTGKIYHLKYSPPETEEIAERLTQRFDDTERKVKLRLVTHNSNVESVLSIYKDLIVKVEGTLSKEEVFSQIDSILTKLLETKKAALGSVAASMKLSKSGNLKK